MATVYAHNKDNGAIVLTAQGLFTAKLILSNEDWFKYKIVWIKSKSTNFLNAKKQPLRKHEDICVFYKRQPTYNPQMTKGESYDKGIRKTNIQEVMEISSHAMCKVTACATLMMSYLWMIMNCQQKTFVCKTAESEGPVYHPTQKPIELGRYLIRTFSNPGDIILDNACGSGSFLVAAAMEDRKYIGIEKIRMQCYIKSKQ